MVLLKRDSSESAVGMSKANSYWPVKDCRHNFSFPAVSSVSRSPPEETGLINSLLPKHRAQKEEATLLQKAPNCSKPRLKEKGTTLTAGTPHPEECIFTADPRTPATLWLTTPEMLRTKPKGLHVLRCLWDTSSAACKALTWAAAFISFGLLANSCSSNYAEHLNKSSGTYRPQHRGCWHLCDPLSLQGNTGCCRRFFNRTIPGHRRTGYLLVCRSGLGKAISSGTFNNLGFLHWWFYRIWKLLVPSSHSSLRVTA